jgi:polyisoprenoid-binding protein YceI
MTDSAEATIDGAAAPDSGAGPIVREWEHLIIPVPGVWAIDAGHSILAFDCRHMMLTRLRGWFASFSGDFHIAEKPEESWVEVTINADSLQMPNPVAMAAVKGEHYLQADKFSTLHFRSSRVKHVEAGLWQVTGPLTIKDCSREVTLDANFEGVLPSPPMFGGRAKMAFAARTEFDRRDFGMDANIPLPGGGWLVGNRVGLSLDVEANLA